ncbi:MAG: T9SS type A sorting domain-containing protein [Candidatus Zhuqueibacterota bacterium]
MKIRYSLMTIVFLLIFSELCFAQWSTDASQNTPICTAPNNQFAPQIVVDDKGNSIIVWEDETDPIGYRHIYAQRLNRYGCKMWDERGVPVCSAREYKKIADVISDGEGGAIIVWLDYKNWFHPDPIEETDIYAQRIDSSGVMLWNSDGVDICTAEGNQFNAKAISDNDGGVIVVWQDDRSEYNGVYIQHVINIGQILLSVNGKPLNSQGIVARFGGYNVVHSDSNSIIIFYASRKNNISISTAQKIRENGTYVWSENEKILDISGKCISDNNEGAIFAYLVYQNGNPIELRAQRITKEAIVIWPEFGTSISEQVFRYSRYELTKDDQCGAFIVWISNNDTTEDSLYLYISRVDSSGQLLWIKKCLDKVSTWYVTEGHHIVCGNEGEAILKFKIEISDTLWNQVIQKIDLSGNFLWGNNGIIYVDHNPKKRDIVCGTMTGDAFGGAIIVWDEFGANGWDIYAQQVSSRGQLGDVVSSIHSLNIEINPDYNLAQSYPNPFNSFINISYSFQKGGDVTIKLFNTNGQLVNTLVNKYQKEGNYDISWNGRSSNGQNVVSGVYFYQLKINEFAQTKKLLLIR